MRQISTNWAIGDKISASRLQQINLELDNLYENGDDIGRVSFAQSGTPLHVDIGAFPYSVHGNYGIYAGTTDLAIADNSTKYLLINSAGVLSQENANDTDKALLAIVTTLSGDIVSITNYKSQIFGGYAGTGDMNGPSGAVAHNIMTYASGTGKLAEDSGYSIADVMTGASKIVNHLTDQTYMLGEPIVDLTKACVFVESCTPTGSATTKQNVGDVTGNTRISFPIIGTGVAGTTFSVNLCKTGSPAGNLNFRIETDNAGSPSGTPVTNGTATVTAASLTTSLANTSVTLAGSVTLTLGTKYHVVVFQGTYGSETISGSNYYNIGHSTNNTTTRGITKYNGSAWGNSVGGDVTDANGFSYGFNMPSTVVYQGFRIQAKALLYIKSITKNASSGATIATIKSIDGTILATANFSGNVATLSMPLFLSVGQDVYVLVGNNGSSYTMYYAGGGQTYPQDKTNIKYVAGFRSTSEDTNAYDIASITTYTSAYVGFPYISSTMVENKLLSLTDSDFSYKIGLHGISTELAGIGIYPKLTLRGINANQSGMTPFSIYYLSGTPGAISSTAGTNIYSPGYAISTSKLYMTEVPMPGTYFTFVSLLTSRDIASYSVWTKIKSVGITKSGTYTITFAMTNSGGGSYPSYSRIYKNGIAYGTQRGYTAGTRSEDLSFLAGDTCEIWAIATPTGGLVSGISDFTVKYNIGNFAPVSVLD